MNGRDDFDRIPPNSRDSEQAVIGGLMLVPESLPAVADWLNPEDFYGRDHRLIYEAVRGLAQEQKPFDVVTLGEWFDASGKAEDIGGSAYLIELASTQGSAANITAYAEIVVAKARQRQTIQIGTELVNDAWALGRRDLSEVVHLAQSSLMRLSPAARTGPQPAKDVLLALNADLQRRYEAKVLPGLKTPWLDLNELTHGLQDGETTLIAARTNTGKSLAGFQLAMESALAGNRTLVFSLEMTAEAVMRRMVSCKASIPYGWMIQPRDMDDEFDSHPEHGDYWSNLTEGFRALRNAPLLIDDTPNLTAPQITARAQREHLRQPIRLIVVDHLHDMGLPGKQGEVIERAQALRDLKALGKVLRCPVVVLAQLNRDSAAKNGEANNPRPVLRNLRGSGGIEEVADVVLMMWAPDDMPHSVEVIIAKGRDIKTGESVWLKAEKWYMRLSNGGERWIAPTKTTTKTRWAGVGRDRSQGDNG